MKKARPTKLRYILLGATIMLAGCSKNPGGRDMIAREHKAFDVAEAPPPGEAPPPPGIVAPAGEQAAAIAVEAPQIAYSYGFTYTLPGAAIAAAQARHVALCDRLGAARCRIVRMERAGSTGEFGSGALKLVVEARIARGFGDRLDAAVAAAGGDTAGRTMSAEDLSKQIVDTDARVRAKQALADRLLELIRNRNGKVGELVEAERAFAATQEELDAARSWLAQMRQRVAMSEINIGYMATNQENGSAWAPIRQSLALSGQALGTSVGALVTFAVLAAPWAILLSGLIWLRRRRGWRWPFRRSIA